MKGTNRLQCVISILNSPIIITLIIGIVTLVNSVHVLLADFVFWDDPRIFFNNPNLKPISIKHLQWIFTDTSTLARYCPLALLSWSLIYTFWKLDPFYYHLFSWLLYGLNSILLFFILKKITISIFKDKYGISSLEEFRFNLSALLATLFWALHPMRVETVAWATDLTYGQAAFFLFLSIHFYLKANDFTFNSRSYNSKMLISVFFLLFSILSHPIGVTFPFVLIILDRFVYKRIGGEIGWIKTLECKKIIFEKFLFFLPSLIIGLITTYIRLNSKYFVPTHLPSFPLFDRFVQAMYVIVYYTLRPFYPLKLAPVYSSLVGFDSLSWPFLGSTFLVFVTFFTLYIFRDRWPLILALVLAYLFLLAPSLGIFDYPYYTVDRYSLISSICFSVGISCLLYSVRKIKYYASISVVSFALVILLGSLFNKQIKIWNNSESLFTYIIKTMEDDPYRQDIYWRLGLYFSVIGKKEKAIQNMKETLRINPSNLTARYHAGKLSYELKLYNEALNHFKIYLKIKPHAKHVRYYKSILEDILGIKHNRKP